MDGDWAIVFGVVVIPMETDRDPRVCQGENTWGTTLALEYPSILTFWGDICATLVRASYYDQVGLSSDLEVLGLAWGLGDY